MKKKDGLCMQMLTPNGLYCGKFFPFCENKWPNNINKGFFGIK